jgi:hypothetical protein
MGLPPKNPRVKKQKPQNPPKIIYQHLSNKNRLSKVIPANVKIAIAGAIIAFSEMESTVDVLIWRFAGLSADDGKLLLQVEAKEKFENAKKLSERYGIPAHPHSQTTLDIWANVRTLIEARNKIAHGVWRMIDKAAPISISHRLKSELGHDESEHFSLQRLRDIKRACERITRQFNLMIEQIEPLPARPLPQPRQPPASRPEYPSPKQK